MSSLVWLITGASPGGLGHYLAKAALAAGHKVIATSRKPEKTPEAVAEIEKENNAVWVQLDVTDVNLEQRIEECVQKFGKIDVLVNNAGYDQPYCCIDHELIITSYAIGGALEDCTIDDIRRQLETNFFGPVRTMKALIPHMRERGTGTIINVTSTEGLLATPAISIYGSSKFALEAVSESMHAELAPFGIRVLLVEPGGMRTNFFDPANVVEAPMSEPYKGGIVEHVIAAVRASAGEQMLDPERSAKRIVEAIDGGGEGWPEKREQYLRLPLGNEVIGRIKGKIESLQANVDATEKIWSSVDFPA